MCHPPVPHLASYQVTTCEPGQDVEEEGSCVDRQGILCLIVQWEPETLWHRVALYLYLPLSYNDDKTTRCKLSTQRHR